MGTETLTNAARWAHEDSRMVVQGWAIVASECPAGPELYDLLQSRPGRPSGMRLSPLPVTGGAVLPRSGPKVRRDDAARASDGPAAEPAPAAAAPIPIPIPPLAADMPGDESGSTTALPADPAAQARAHNAVIAGAEWAWAGALLTSIEATQKVMSWLAARQAADLADLAQLANGYPGLLEHLPSEVAMALRITDAEAGQLIHFGQRLATELTGTASALASGLISADVADAIHDATGNVDTDVAAEVEARVLPEAPYLTRRQTYRRCQQIIAALDPDEFAKRRKKAVTRRGVWRELCADGMARMTLYGPAERVASVWQATGMLADAAAAPNDDRTLTQRRFDTLIDVTDHLLTTGTWTGDRTCTDAEATDDHGTDNQAGRSTNHTRRRRPRSPVVINVHVPLSSLTGATDTPAFIDGFGAVDATTARTIAADATWRRILTDPVSGTVLDVGRTRYQPPQAMAEHVQLRDLTCRRPGCDQPSQRCDLDHREPFRPGQPAGGTTSAANLWPLCRHHHREIDGGGSHLTQHHDGTWTWTTALGRTYRRPPTTIFDPGDNQASTPEYQNPDHIPSWAWSRVPDGSTPAPAPAPAANAEQVPQEDPPF